VRACGGGPNDALIRKIRALWVALHNLGALRDASEQALAAFVKRQTGRDALAFLTPADANKAIGALKAWCAREGFSQPDADAAGQIDAWRRGAGLGAAGAALAPRVALIVAQWERLIALGAMQTGQWARLETWLSKKYGVAAPHFLSVGDADGAIRALGAWIRKTKGAS
jgi:hypothetical protein